MKNVLLHDHIKQFPGRYLSVDAPVNSNCALPPPPGNCEAFARLGGPGGGALANFVRLGGRALVNLEGNPRAFGTKVHGLHPQK